MVIGDWRKQVPASRFGGADRPGRVGGAREPTASWWGGRRVTRRGVEITLGVLWLVDGALQFQPSMFTRGFFVDMLGMANMGLPGPVSTVEYDLTSMLAAHPALWNALFAALQVALGAGLLWRRTARAALGLSILWALSVWIVGEGVGGLFMGGTNLLTGAPGAALLYALIAVTIWPRRASGGALGGPVSTGGGVPGAPVSTHGGVPGASASGGVGARAGRSVADEGVLGGALARWMWLLVWLGTAALELEPASHTPAAQLTTTGEGEPGAVTAVNHAIGGLFNGRDLPFVVVFAFLQVAVGVGVLAPRTRRPALAAGVALALATGLAGQDLGGLLTGHATDPGTGPVLALFAVTLWPRTAVGEAFGAGPAAVPGGALAR
ncbi:hypothetical protein [Streptomyces sp. NPDC014806]|uniref:hypothetical protein n=1 Tax=Streptomyces sp. NPDC014806 TaxID=3364920 RepID=UPI0036FCF22C